MKLLLSLLCLATIAIAQPILGGFSPVAPTDADALAAAKFAVAKHDAKLTFQAIEKAEHQVVAGMNYRMTVRVLDAG